MTKISDKEKQAMKTYYEAKIERLTGQKVVYGETVRPKGFKPTVTNREALREKIGRLQQLTGKRIVIEGAFEDDPKGIDKDLAGLSDMASMASDTYQDSNVMGPKGDMEKDLGMSDQGTQGGTFRNQTDKDYSEEAAVGGQEQPAAQGAQPTPGVSQKDPKGAVKRIGDLLQKGSLATSLAALKTDVQKAEAVVMFAKMLGGVGNRLPLVYSNLKALSGQGQEGSNV